MILSGKGTVSVRESERTFSLSASYVREGMIT